MESMNTERANSSSANQELRDLADRIELTDLVSRLGLWLDEKRFDDANSILTEDVWVRTSTGSVEGIAAATDQARRSHDFPATHHVITNVLVDLAADNATIHANLIVTFVLDHQTPSHRTLGERYQFSARRTTAGWRLSGIEATRVWTTTAPRDQVPLRVTEHQ
jgi:hypothetical protein